MVDKQIYSINKILKPLVRLDTYSGVHSNCFRVSTSETTEHINTKFLRWLFWRKTGSIIYTELRLKNGDRPDLIIIKPNGEIICEEIVKSESEVSLKNKAETYPFKINIIRTEE